jgi:hypothetical protein
MILALCSCEKSGIESGLVDPNGEASLGLLSTIGDVYCGEFGPAAECPVEGSTIEDRDDNIKASVKVSSTGEYTFSFDSGDDQIFEEFEMDFRCDDCEHSIPDSDEYNGLVFSPAHSSGYKRLYIGLKKGDEYYGFQGFADQSCGTGHSGMKAR